MELRELPPGGREVQLPRGSSSPPGLSSDPLSWPEVRLGGWRACLLAATRGQFAALPALPILAGPAQRQPGRPPARPRDLQKLPVAAEPGARWEAGGEQRRPSARRALPSLLFPPVFKSRYMGFCPLGTSSSFQICPGTSGAVTGMLRTRSVASRDCTNERVQALLVSRGGIGLLPPQPRVPAAQQHPPIGFSFRRVGSCPHIGVEGLRWAHTLQSWATLWLTLRLPAAVFSASTVLGFLEVGGLWREPNQAKSISNFERRGMVPAEEPDKERSLSGGPVSPPGSRCGVGSLTPQRGFPHPAP